MALMPLVLLAVVAGAILVTVIVLSAKAAEARRQGLSTMAVSGGWSVIGSDNRWTVAFAGPPFGHGSERRADDVHERVVNGQRQVAFTYQYTTYETVTSTDSNGNTTTHQQRHDHRYRVLAVALPVPLGTVRISRENLGDKLVRAFGGQD